MRETIISQLEKLEQEQDINILYACESGSRAWGFPSSDSDYDVRFIYIQSPQKYLSIHDKKEAIDLFLTQDLDLIGWDIRKALRLFHKSNASLFEWMQSDIVYKEEAGFIQEIQRLAPTYFSTKASLYHYLGITKHTFNGHLLGEEVNIKKYFYALRPILATLWICNHNSVPPIKIDKLLEVIKDKTEITAEIHKLLENKEKAMEGDMIKPIPALQSFIQESMIDCQDKAVEMSKDNPDIEPLNDLFRKIFGLRLFGEK